MDCTQAELAAAALQTITTHKLLTSGDRVAVGVSGGADSVALLLFLCSLRGSLSLELLVCHLNHRLRGAESDGDEAFVRALAQRYELPFRLCSFDAAREAREAGQGVEEYARVRRYAFFADCAGPDGIVATAHTLNDSVETVLFNLARGTGVRGLCGIPRRRDSIIRPLRDCTRAQVEQYLSAWGQDYREDSTNAQDLYSRNYIRHHVIPALQTLNPALHSAVSRMSDQLEHQWQMTAALAREAEARITLGAGAYDREAFLALPQPVSALLLQQWLEAAGAARSERMTALLLDCVSRGSGAVEVCAGVRFSATAKLLCFVAEPPACPSYHRTLELPKSIGESTKCPTAQGFWLRVTRLAMKKIEIGEKFYNKYLKSLVTCDTIKEPVFVHDPREVDFIFLQGRSHNVIRRYRTGSKGLSAGQISRMAVAEDAGGLLWAQRLGCDQRRIEDSAAEEYYLFEVLEDRET